MEFAGREFIYLSKLKKEKINKIRKSEEENKEEAPRIQEELKKEDKKEKHKKEEGINLDEKEDERKKDKKLKKKKNKKINFWEEDNGKKEDKKINFKKEEEENDDNEEEPINEEIEEMSIKLQKYSGNKIKRKYSGNSCISDDARLSICSGVFGRDFENYSIDIEAAPMNSPEKKGQIFYKEIDTNICLVRYNELKYDAENTILASHQCKKCQAYLNKYSSLNKSEENGKYEWICEFCSEINKDLAINEKDIPTKDCVEKCLQPPKENEKKN